MTEGDNNTQSPTPGNPAAKADDRLSSKPVKDGFDAPIADPGDPSKVPAHVHPDTLMAKGIDPETKETVTVNLAVLQKQRGEKEGRALYNRVARIGGFFDPNGEPSGSDFAPDLQLEGMDKKTRASVDALLNS